MLIILYLYKIYLSLYILHLYPVFLTVFLLCVLPDRVTVFFTRFGTVVRGEASLLQTTHNCCGNTPSTLLHTLR
jgi:hypothetical protein